MDMTGPAAPRLRGLTRPRQAWAQLGGTAKYILYNRISLQALSVVLGGFFVLPVFVGGEVEFSAPVTLVVGVGIVTGLVAALLVLEFHPDLNSRPRRPVRPYFATGGGGTVLLWLGSILVAFFAERDDVVIAATYLANAMLFQLSLAYLSWLHRRWLATVVLSVVNALVLWPVVGDLGALLVLIYPGFIVGSVLLSVWAMNLLREVERSRRTEAELKVSEERLRFAQELHDTLGQHLAAMSVKAELALALAQRGDDRLAGELRQLQQLTRTSMSELHEVVDGYRSINLATEVEGARSLLRDAGVAVTVQGDSFDVPKPDREIAAWFIREATTNVLKHSDATTVGITLAAGAVTMTNDGVTADVGKIGGLGALRRRAEARGAQLLTERDGTQFTVTLIPRGSP